MNKARELRALVVDDEAAVRELIVRYLSEQGFECETAGDGNQAEERLAKVHYDVVITDLRMPNKHGHALAVHLLALKTRPVIVVHTSVIEPKLAKDLLARGVDDIVFKPIDLSLLAVKVSALVARRDARHDIMQNGTEATEDEMPSQLLEDTAADKPVSLAQVEKKLSGLTRILPISAAGLEVYEMTSTDEWEVSAIAAAIQRDATLAAEVLRLANSAFYNATEKRIFQLERAIVQIGQKRIGELAIATNALTALTSCVVPWLNVGLTWKRSMAAGLAIEMLVDEGSHQYIERGLLLSAIMHPLGRLIMGALYPKHYEMMVETCRCNGGSLLDQERQAFPISHAEAVAHLLAAWGIPADIYRPLEYVLTGYGSLITLPEPSRLKAELLKLAIFLGNLAVGEWETWDVVEIPSAALFRKLGINHVSDVIEYTKRDVAQLATFHTNRPERCSPKPLPTPSRKLAYCNMSGSPRDFLEPIISTMGIELAEYSEDDLSDRAGTIVVNCIGTGPQRLAAKIRSGIDQALVIVTDADRVEQYGGYGQVVSLPTSYGRLRTVCFDASYALKQPQELLR